MKEIKTKKEPAENLNGLFFLYTCVCKNYLTVEGKPESVCYFTDGTVTIPISRKQLHMLIGQALQKDRYRVGSENHLGQTETKLNNQIIETGKPETNTLRNTEMYHVFLKQTAAEEVLADYSGDTSIHFMQQQKQTKPIDEAYRGLPVDLPKTKE